ncbi:MAG: DUF692 domain-containing protein [Burkholderiales bacterium]
MRPPSSSFKPPDPGFGLGLRTAHYEEILCSKPRVDWFEVLSENYLVPGGKPLHYLDRIRERYPCVMHGVSLSAGSCDPVDWDYMKQIKALAARIEPNWISDHLCWTGVAGKNSHDLLPIPYTDEALRHTALKVRQVQDFLGQRILLENVSSYVSYRESRLTEWEFLSALSAEADCLLLLDVNNIYVSAFNHDFDAEEFLRGVPACRVGQIHLAGHSHCGEYIIDTHDAAVADPVWGLYEKAVEILGPVPAMIERDDRIPPLADLVAELDIVRRIASRAPRTLPV